jgi:hypothetical protein
MATPFIGMIRLACLQFLPNFAAIDDLHLRETDATYRSFFDRCGYRIEKPDTRHILRSHRNVLLLGGA